MKAFKREVGDLFETNTPSGEFLSIWEDDDLVFISYSNCSVSIHKEDFPVLFKAIHEAAQKLIEREKHK